MPFSLSDSDLKPEHQLYAAGLLRDDERLLWAGKPVCKLPKQMLLTGVVMVAVFAFVLGNLGYSGFFGALQNADAGAAVLLCLTVLTIPSIILVVGVGSPLWYLYRMANSFYLITDRRYLSVCKYPLLGFRQQEWTGTPLAVTAESDGTGDIVMEYRVRKNKGNVSVNPIGLLHIPNVAQVRELLTERLNVDAPVEADDDPEESTRMTPPSHARKSGFLFLALAVGAWAYGLFSAAETHEKLSSWSRVEGVVTSLERSTTHSRRGAHTSYRACYRFEVDGVRYDGKQSVASNPPAYRKGEKLTVVYNPSHPYESDADSAFDLYFKSFGFGFVGLVLFCIASVRLNAFRHLKMFFAARQALR